MHTAVEIEAAVLLAQAKEVTAALPSDMAARYTIEIDGPELGSGLWREFYGRGPSLAAALDDLLRKIKKEV